MKRPLSAVGAALLVGGLLAGFGSATTATAAPSKPDPSQTPLAAAARALTEHRPALQASTKDAFTLRSSAVDADGGAHVHYDRTYQGLRVYGGDTVVHTAPDGGFAKASVGLTKPLTLGTTAKVTPAAAAAAAKKAFQGTITEVGTPEKIVDATSGSGVLAYQTEIKGWAPDGQTPSRLQVVTDAATGAVRDSWDEIETVDGTGRGIYVGTVTISTTGSGSSYTLTDPTHGNGNTCDMNNTTTTCSTMTDTDNVWGTGAQSSDQSAAVDAHYGAALTFDYFKNNHGRNGIFNNGAGVPSRVHYGSSYVNAFWDGAQMTYGDGSGNAEPLVSLDVAGHEMSHGVTENTANLNYTGESGGLNEATSDIFGTMVEFSANNTSDPGDYQIGEEIDINGDGTPLRYMYNPTLDGASHGCWSSSTNSVDVHYSSGPGNHFFFDLAEGTGSTAYGTSPVCGSAAAVTGIGRAKAAAIWYRALSTYFTSTTRYYLASNLANSARAHTLSAATDLYGNCSTEYKAVQAAWTAVNVAGADATCSTTGNSFTLSLSSTSGTVAPGSSVATTAATVNTGTAQTVAFTASGLPTGATATFNPSSITSGASSTLTIATTSATPAGTYTITVTGTGTSVTRTVTYTLTVSGTGGGSCTATQLFANAGFESGATSWTQSTTGIIGIHSTQPARTGSYAAWLNGNGSTSTQSIYQQVALPTGCTTYNLSFYLHIDTAETTTSTQYDKVQIQVLNTSGTVLGTLGTYSNLNAASGYTARSFSLASYAGQTVRIRFYGTEDSSLQTSFTIDDTALNIS
ncbi:M4 family metallopeptidase [Actinoplanes rectilineatus]|uniref:M4 family metallopeptidase n=1 Tax=Actinoplanes rectilineatus TaxID=113571 RepID=UPI0005F2FE23|nr:M4 family metallopeptidase [Actinoplanes rectilineatus]